MTWTIDGPCGNEAAKVKYDIVEFTRGAVLDLGCGPWKAFPHFVGIDNCLDNERLGFDAKPDITVPDCANLDDAVESNSVNAIFSSHLLEHIQDTEAALTSWWDKIKVGGYLILYLPHRDLYPQIGQPGANLDHKHDFVPGDIIRALSNINTSGFDIVIEEVRDQGNEYSFLQVFKKTGTCEIRRMTGLGDTKPEKTVCISRFGGFGDMLMMSNILPELKRQGYHITVNTTPKGRNIVEHDPHIDAWMIQDDDQVPNNELPYFWQSQAKRFDKFINLSESVEGTLLGMPGRANHAWPDSVRRDVMGKNYLEWSSQLAELPYTSEARFYPSDDEALKSKKYLAGIKNRLAGELLIGQRAPDRFNIMWVLSGSSIHKFYPHQDAVIARIMLEMPEAVVIFNGDYACQILEAGWEIEPRVYLESGKMGIRESLALAQQVDCVVGPETGVLNAVGFESNAKVIMLSHSSKENLTKHWVNTTTLEPHDTPCYPCHRLHYGRDFCHEDANTGGAMCQINISIERTFAAIKRHYDDWKLMRSVMRAAA